VALAISRYQQTLGMYFSLDQDFLVNHSSSIMNKVVSVYEAKTHLSRLLEEAHAGSEIIVSKGGKPYAKLVPLTPVKKRPLGFLKAQATDEAFFEPLPEEELLAWEGAAEDFDASST
jgi:prevent-host-death family protein